MIWIFLLYILLGLGVAAAGNNEDKPLTLGWVALAVVLWPIAVGYIIGMASKERFWRVRR